MGTIIPSSVALRAVDLYELASISEVEAFAAYSAAAVCKIKLYFPHIIYLVLSVFSDYGCSPDGSVPGSSCLDGSVHLHEVERQGS